MFIKFGSTLAAILLLITTNTCVAADEGQSEDLGFNMDMGRKGEPMLIEDPSVLRICADKDNLPYSNEKQEGFENKIAALIAKDLGRKVQYQFWYDRLGYIRNTLNAHRCDVLISTVAGNDMVLTSAPYYRSGYVFVYKKDSGLNITDWNSPDLRKVRIGLVGETPPSRPLSDLGLMDNARPYRLMRDLNQPPSLIIDDLIKGDIDLAIIWGPIGGYFAKNAPMPLVVNEVPEYEAISAHGKVYWNISVGVRKGDKERLAMIEEVLKRRKADIDRIMDDYGIPHFPVIQEKKGGEKEKRGEVDVHLQ